MNADLQELEALRTEVTALRAAVLRQSLISNEHIQRAISQRVHSIHRENLRLYVVALIGAASWCFLYLYLPLSLPLLLFALAFLGACVVDMYFLERLLSFTHDLNTDILGYIQRVERFRRKQMLHELYSIPGCIILIGGIVYEMRQTLPPERFHVLLLCVAVGFIIGGAFGLRKFLSDRRRAREIIDHCRLLLNESEETK